ncbi:MAG: magnesium chelatase domain-containing protein, partial [Phycicoccus sp.]
MTFGLGRTRAVALLGLEGAMVDVEAHIGSGLPHFSVGGLPDAACAGAPDRIRPAAATAGVAVPPHRVTVNLSPASIPKRGAGFDLPIAVAVLSAAGFIRSRLAAEVVHLGELALDGTVRGVRGVLPAVLEAGRRGVRHVVVARENVAEAQLVDRMTVHGASTLGEVVEWYRSVELGGALPSTVVATSPSGPVAARSDLADVV